MGPAMLSCYYNTNCCSLQCIYNMLACMIQLGSKWLASSIFFLLCCFGNRDPPTQMSFLTSLLQLVTSAMQGGIVVSIMSITSPSTPIWVLFTQIVPRSHISQAQYQVASLITFSRRLCNVIHGPVMRFSGQILVTLIGQLYLVSMNTLCGNQKADQFLIVVEL